MHRFYLNNGKVISTLDELAQILPSLSEGIFSYHVNDHKNDFANWISDVFGEKSLAKQIMSISREEMAKKINAFNGKPQKGDKAMVKEAGSVKKQSANKPSTAKASRIPKPQK
jgi:hypothetical protein